VKKLQKIIALFLFIFLAGILITVISINITLDKNSPKKTTILTNKDTLILVKAVKETV